MAASAAFVFSTPLPTKKEAALLRQPLFFIMILKKNAMTKRAFLTRKDQMEEGLQ
jgi:hypothetical protein